MPLILFKRTHAALPNIVLPPADQPDPYWNNVVLLMSGDNKLDATGKTVNDVGTPITIDTNMRRTGTGSLYYKTSNAGYLSVPASPDFQWQGQSFTIEAWVRCADNLVQDNPIMSTYQNSSTGLILSRYNGYFSVWLSGDRIDISGTTLIQPNVWYHVAVSGSPGAYRLFVNGVQEGVTYTSLATSLNSTVDLKIGAFLDRRHRGWLDDVRITKGVSRYNANFAVPTREFANY